MKLTFMRTVLIGSLSISTIQAQYTPEMQGFKSINEDIIKAQMSFLASDWMEGRAVGEKGDRMAGDYIASMLQLYGIQPFGDQIKTSGAETSVNKRSYFQNFVLLKSLPGNGNVLQIRSAEGKTVRTITLTEDVDYTVWAGDPSSEITAPVVFAGYGYRNDELRYNDFAKLDVKGKFILKISGYPAFASDKIRNQDYYRLSMKTDSLYKALGVAGVIEFNTNSNVVGRPHIPDFMNMSPAEGSPRSGKPRVSWSIPGDKINDSPKRAFISVKAANELLKGTGIDINEYISKADRNQPYTINQQVTKEIYLKTSVITTQVPVRNVLGIIEGKKNDEFIVLGAHYDHVGFGNGYLWNGADDNASGTVGVMTIARAIMETGQKPEKSIIIALWDAEETGLMGSRYYVDNTGFPLNQIKLNLNFDMISRYISDSEPDKVTMTYTEKYPVFRDITAANLQKYNIRLDVDYQPSVDPPGGSDHRTFTAKGIAVMRFKPGHREEYHQPGDELSTIDWDIMEKIIKISYLNTWQLSNSEW